MQSIHQPTSHSEHLRSLLHTKFGFPSFRLHQEEVCRKITEGNDVLVVMPTGAGKSLCYQLPGLARNGTTIVVSPLLALIEDQVEKLKKSGLSAERIHSGRKREELRQACVQYLNGSLDFLFIAPERFSVPGFIEMLKKRPPSLLAIDEAHCISQWGHDFRPDYRLLGERIKELRPAPVVALTATATALVQDDICKQLGLEKETRSIHGFRRDNIAIQIVELSVSDRPTAIQSVLKQKGSMPAIVYAPTRKIAEELHLALKSGFRAGIYHAGMSPTERDHNQTLFLKEDLDVIVATIAFGMGIDKSNIRTVIHAALPSSVEGYYQEIGRAGRDGKPSKAILFYSYADQRTHEFFFEKNYPEVSLLNEVYKTLTEEKVPKATLKENLKLKNKELDDEVLDKILEKLTSFRGAVIDFEENVSKGTATWEKIYVDQRKHKQQQSQLMTQFTQSSRCRMISLVRHFGDQQDAGNPCGLCDFCRPSDAQAIQTTRTLTIIEQQLVAQIMAVLTSCEYRAAGRLFEDLASKNPKLQRREFERLLLALGKAQWIDVTEDTFIKEGESISYRKISSLPAGERATANQLGQLQSSGLLTSSSKANRPKKPRTRLRKKGTR